MTFLIKIVKYLSFFYSSPWSARCSDWHERYTRQREQRAQSETTGDTRRGDRGRSGTHHGDTEILTAVLSGITMHQLMLIVTDPSPLRRPVLDLTENVRLKY